MSSPNHNGDVVPPPDGVCCSKCEEKALAHLTRVEQMFKRTFIVCTLCGNKRCPKATDHELACTNSNEPGQPGSRYA
jgi:hypothetical protein